MKNRKFDIEEFEKEDTKNSPLHDEDKIDTRNLKEGNINNKRKSIVTYFIAGVLSTVLIGGIAIASYLYYYSLPQNVVKNYKEYFNDYRQYVTVEDSYIKMEEDILLQDGYVYIPYNFIKSYIDEYIFYEPNANLVTITSESNVIKMNTDELTYFVNEDPLTLTAPIIQHSDTAYLPKEFVENTYNVTLKYDNDTDILNLNYNDLPSNISTAEKKIKVRFNYVNDSYLTTRIQEGETFEIYNEYEEYTKVRTSNGLLGYVKTSDINSTEIVEATVLDSYSPKNIIDGKITLLWDQIYSYSANKLPNKQNLPIGVDVVSPTWFKFDETALDGTILSLADNSYVDAIHNQGGEVWPILTDNFSSKVSSTILRNPEYRRNVIRQILALSVLYDFDGINIDFEAVQPSDSEYFIQFLRELYPEMKKNDLVLSVDTFVPSDWSMYYNRRAIAETVDYVVVMTYDEHTSVSQTTGPVASLGFVDNGIKNTLKEVPKNQVLMGIPFYTRVWKVREDGSFTISNRSMDAAIDLFKRNNATFTEDVESGYTYATFDYVENGQNVKYEAWLENGESIKKKLNIYEKYDVGGVALWSRDLEQNDTFEIINKVVN